MLSVTDADPEGSTALLRARGKVEDEAVAAGFERLVVYRPAYLYGKQARMLKSLYVVLCMQLVYHGVPTGVPAGVPVQQAVHTFSKMLSIEAFVLWMC